MVKKYLFFVVFVFFLQIAYAEDYYADLEISVDNMGFVTIDGNTNYPGLLSDSTEKYTSKKQSYWLLDISTNDVFSDYFISVNLPEGASVNYIKSSGNFRIEGKGDRLAVNAFGHNKPLSIIVQYQAKKKASSYVGVLVVALIVFIGIVLYYLIKRKKAFKKQRAKVKKIKEEPEYNLSGLTARQKKIMRLLIEKGKLTTQSEIEKELKIPKASVSRNIQTLELKGRVEKEKTGMSNIIRLKK